MATLLHTLTQLSAFAASSLVNAVAEALLLAAVISLCLRLIPGIKPAARFVIWTAALLAVLPLHLLPILGSHTHSSLSAPATAFHLDARWSLLILCSWAALSFVRAVRLLRGALHLRRIAATATPVQLQPELIALLQNAPRPAQLCTSNDVDRPSVIGFLHPRILLPPTLLQTISPQELEQILLHEMEHLRRRDDWTNLLQKVSLILFPLNPVLNWIERRLCIERELACDDCVLHCTSSRKTYATCLTNLAEHTMLRRRLTLALGAWEKQSELTRRVHRILRRPEARMRPTTANLVTGTMIAGLLAGAFTLSRSPQLVSFSTPSAPLAAAIAPASATMPTAERVSTRSTRNFAPTLVKAVMPDSRPATAVPTHLSTTSRKPLATKPIHRASARQAQNWIVLTGWKVVSVPTHSTLLVNQASEPSYAAVSVGNGWLVIQL